MTQQGWPSIAPNLEFTGEEAGMTGPYLDKDVSFAFTPLTHQQLLKVEGKDAFSFLQGQLSCDLRAVIREGSRLGAHCNIKGHMISLFRVMAQEETCFWLRTHQSLAEKALAQLKKYIVFSKATATLEVSQLGIGFTGTDVIDGLKHLLQLSEDEIPVQASHSLIKDNWVLCCIHPHRYELWTHQEFLKSLLPEVVEKAQAYPLQQWLLQDIREGIADLRSETSEVFIPQMTNLQVFDGVSFNKGCYTGQEIVTRLQHRGVLKRPMYRAGCHTSETLTPGMLIHCDDKKGVGQVVLAAETEQAGYWELLAVLVKDRAENSSLWLGDHQTVEILDLPYTLDARLFESKR